MDIVLTTLNAKYIHASFGLRCLRANLGTLRDRSMIREFTIQERPVDVVEALLAEQPRMVGIGVYVWNATQCLSVVRLLKALAPEVIVVLGGPEVSHEHDLQEIVALADHLVLGEGETAFAALADARLSGRAAPKILPGGLPDLSRLVLPYDEYTAEDVAHRVLYVEASRGCPFSCEFCLSSLDTKVRAFPLQALLGAFNELIQRGARKLKFVDRTFNLSPKVSEALLDFLLERQHLGLFAHFEMIPDRFPAGLRERLARFPDGAIQLEVGIQSFDEATSARISRRQDVAAIEANLGWLRSHTGAHIHADLIVGLPGEDLAGFALGFDRLVALGPHEIQIGILKRLRGTPIARHDAAEAVVWNSEPPYELLQNRHIDFQALQRMKRLARAWDLVVSSGHFPTSAHLIWAGMSPFAGFQAFTDWLAGHVVFTGIGLPRLAELLLRYLIQERGMEADAAAERVAEDFLGPGRRMPPVLQPYVAALERSRRLTKPEGDVRTATALPARQARHHSSRGAD